MGGTGQASDLIPNEALLAILLSPMFEVNSPGNLKIKIKNETYSNTTLYFGLYYKFIC